VFGYRLGEWAGQLNVEVWFATSAEVLAWISGIKLNVSGIGCQTLHVSDLVGSGPLDP
jgi:hypothetical protein